jgi:hypothetical protein
LLPSHTLPAPFPGLTGPIEPDPPYGTIFHLDDGSGPIRIFVCTSTGIDLSGLAPGQQVSVIGMSCQFIDYEVDPRFQSDIRWSFSS